MSEQMSFELSFAPPNNPASEFRYYAIDMKQCGNKECGKFRPMFFFSYCKIRGRIYRRSWCKPCEASRERQRHSQVVKTRQSREDSETAHVSTLIRRFFRVSQ